MGGIDFGWWFAVVSCFVCGLVFLDLYGFVVVWSMLSLFGCVVVLFVWFVWMFGVCGLWVIFCWVWVLLGLCIFYC